MKKLLLTTGIFLSIGLIASAQEKKASTATTTPAAATQGTPPAAIAKQRNNQNAFIRHDNTATKNQIIQDRENGVNRAAVRKTKKPAKVKATDTKTN